MTGMGLIGCWLQQNAADAAMDANPIALGALTLKTAPETDGQWLILRDVTLKNRARTGT